MNSYNRQTVDTYNHTVQKYIQTSPQEVTGNLKEWIDENLAALDKNAKILEIGSGSGKDADYFASKGYTLELTDASQGFVSYLNNNGKQARVLNALIDDFGTNYDMIFADAVFLHFTPAELKVVLQKTYHAVKPGGRLAFSLKAGQGDEVTTRKLDSTRYFCFWQQRDIEKLLYNIGFEQVHTKVIDDYRGNARPDWLLISAIR
jgi:2-polyprenyl-3-methyl-5-hydroxy-6-metoxy-1,4-benzoquinol methylase